MVFFDNFDLKIGFPRPMNVQKLSFSPGFQVEVKKSTGLCPNLVKNANLAQNAHSGPVWPTMRLFFNVFDTGFGLFGSKNVLYVRRYPFLR